jgi:hypothetical protein
MAGLVPAIHVLTADEDVDARDKPGHDVKRDPRRFDASKALDSIYPTG